MECIYCNSKARKNGLKNNKQRYYCPHCNKSFSLTDDRVKRSNKERELALFLYSHNMSQRSIQKTINIMFKTKLALPVLQNWIKTASKQLKFSLNIDKNQNIKQPPRTIEVLELDELYSYYYDLKKNKKEELKYGLLLTETEIKLLHLI